MSDICVNQVVVLRTIGENYDEYRLNTELSEIDILIRQSHGCPLVSIYKLTREILSKDPESQLFIENSVSKLVRTIDLRESRTIVEYMTLAADMQNQFSTTTPTILSIINLISVDEEKRASTKLDNVDNPDLKEKYVRRSSYVDDTKPVDYKDELDPNDWVKRLERLNRKTMFDGSTEESIAKDMPGSFDKVSDSLKNLSDIPKEYEYLKDLQKVAESLGDTVHIQMDEHGKPVAVLTYPRSMQQSFIEGFAKRLGITPIEFPKSKTVDKRDPYTHEPERIPTRKLDRGTLIPHIKCTVEPRINKRVISAILFGDSFANHTSSK